MANHRSLLAPFGNKRCTGHRQHASVCIEELVMAAQCAPKKQSLFVEAHHIAHGIFAVRRDSLHDHPHVSPALVANALWFDLGDPAIPRHPGGRIVQPPSGGRGTPCMCRQCQHARPITQQKPQTL
eukprot:9120078-Pyramimonas_sp.AAC.1